MSFRILVLALSLAATLAQARQSSLPDSTLEPVRAGQSWTYKRNVTTPATSSESRIIFRVVAGKGNDLVVESMPAQLTGRPVAWKRGPQLDNGACMIDFFGTGSLGIMNSCSTTFEPGMDWTTEATVKGTRIHQRYQVLDVETMTVGAGTFQAVKIEAFWEAGKGKAGKRKPTHHVTYWYAPETRAMVKVHREFFNDSGTVESESTEELEGYRPLPAR